LNAIDLFAGGGGFSEGAKNANVNIVWAANHNPLAVEFHALNHPGATHVCQDLHQADWTQVPDHDIMLASPCCQGHTSARGKERPHHDKQRSTAWAVVSCAEYHREQVVVVENVPEFRKWVLYPAWLDAMHRLGYACRPYLVDAADHGVPQNRERLFLVFTRSKHPLELNFAKHDHVGADQFIEWDAHKWSPIIKPGRSQATLQRISAGRAAHGRRFVSPFYGSGSGKTGRSIFRPIGTITTIDRWAVIDGDYMRMLQPSEVRTAMGFRSSYQLPRTRREAILLMGNAVSPPVATDFLSAIRAVA